MKTPCPGGADGVGVVLLPGLGVPGHDQLLPDGVIDCVVDQPAAGRLTVGPTISRDACILTTTVFVNTLNQNE